MTIVVIGPLAQDQIITPNSKTYAAGGASYFQSFVFEEFNIDYVAVANFNNLDLIRDFPNLGNLIPIVGDDILLMNILKTIIWTSGNNTAILQTFQF